MTMPIKFPLLLGAVALLAAACSGGAPSEDPGSGIVELEQMQSSPKADVASALKDPAGEDLPEPLVDPGDIISGGLPPDGIPSIDRPKFQKASSVDWIDPKRTVDTTGG